MWWKNRESQTTIARVRELELMARRVAEGVLVGLHRSRHRGGSIEFSEHKPYSAGDEIRLIDWKLYAKSDRYYVKQFEDETRLQAYIILDYSGSMKYRGIWKEEGNEEKMSKLDYARICATALGYLLLNQGDQVGAIAFRENKIDWLPARSGREHFLALSDFFIRNEPAGKADFKRLFIEVIERIKKRSLIILFSDFFGDQDEIIKGLRSLSLKGEELIVFQVLDPDELEFPFMSLSWFEGLEGEERLLLDGGSIRKDYLAHFGSYLDELKNLSLEPGIDYELLKTRILPSDALVCYLLRRSSERGRKRV